MAVQVSMWSLLEGCKYHIPYHFAKLHYGTALREGVTVAYGPIWANIIEEHWQI